MIGLEMRKRTRERAPDKLCMFTWILKEREWKPERRIINFVFVRGRSEGGGKERSNISHLWR